MLIHIPCGTPAPCPIGIETACTGIYSRRKHEISRQLTGACNPVNHYPSRFKRLPQLLHNPCVKACKLIKKQHSLRRKRHLPRFNQSSTAYKRRRRNRMMWCTERSYTHIRSAAKLSGYAVNAGKLKLFILRHAGHNGRNTRYKHRLSSSRRSHKQYIVSSRNGCEHGFLGILLTIYI